MGRLSTLSCDEERMTLQGDCGSLLSLIEVVFREPELVFIVCFSCLATTSFFKVRSYFTSFYPGEMEILGHPEVETFLFEFLFVFFY